VTSAAARTSEVLTRLAAVPAVRSVAAAATAPFAGVITDIEIDIEGQTARKRLGARRHLVSESYFATLEIPVASGRVFDGSDGYGQRAAVVSREFERRYLDGRAIGRRFSRSPQMDAAPPKAYDVIGVVGDTRQRGYADDDVPAFYLLNRQSGVAGQFVVRTERDPAPLLPVLRDAIRDLDRRVYVTATHTMSELLARSTAEERFRAVLSAVFGGAALILSAVGMYGLASRRVAERRREIGVRMALGARPSAVRSLVLADAVRIVGVGVVVGLPAALGASILVRHALFGVSPTAWHVLGLAVRVLGVATVTATLIPAFRATRIDPVLVLRE
jgi:ABC-type antimicrobial peptide transport system permease subunit